MAWGMGRIGWIAGGALRLCLSIAMADSISSQTPQTTLTSRTELVTVPVVVTDTSGSHIHGLKREDFTLFEEGAEQPIAVFEEIRHHNVPTPRDPTLANQFSNVRAESSPGQLTIVVLDMLNTLVEDQVHAKDELVKFVIEPGNAEQPISVLAIDRSGVKLIHNFSRDTKELAKALHSVQRSQTPVTEEPSQALLPDGKDKLDTIIRNFGEFQVDSERQALSFDRRRVVTLTLQGMQQIAQAFTGFEGRKTLVWASGGFPFMLNETTMALKEAGPGVDTPADMQPLYEKTWEALSRAQISVYPVDVHGLGELPGPATKPLKKALGDPFLHGQWLHAETNASFKLFAQATGGREYLNQNGLQSAIHSAVEDSASYYQLGYYLHREKKKEGWRKLQVKVQRDGLHVLARTGFFLQSSSAKIDDTSPDTMRVALDSPLEYTGIPITAKWEETKTASERGKKKAIFILTMPPGFAEVDERDRNRFALDFWALARGRDGRAAGDVEQTMEGHFQPEAFDRFRTKGTNYRGALTVAPGEYTVRFVVRDRLSGRIGTLSAPLKVSP